MTTTDSFANVDTATLEAALEAASSGVDVSMLPAAPQAEAEPQPASPENETFEAAETEEEIPPTEAEEISAEQVDEEDPQIGEYEDAPAVEAETYDPRADWQDYERMAAEIRERNPDILLDTALAMAKARLGYSDEEPMEEPTEEGDPEPTTAEKISAIEDALQEEGANEGLFTPRVAELTKELSRLHGHAAQESMREYMSAERQADNDARTAFENREQLLAAMDESRARVLDICPEAGDASSPIGRAMSQLIGDYQAIGHPDLSDPKAPELIFSKANILLPVESRVSVSPNRAPKHQPKAQPAQPRTVQQPSAAQSLPTAPPVPTVRALPVAAGARTAQPDMSNLNPAQMGQMVRDASREDLDAIEEALYGAVGRDVLLRI
jgi:hypothetical protein